MILAERLRHVFHWPATYPIRLVLPGMILLSLAVHVLGLYLVRDKSPAGAAALPPRPAFVTILPGGDQSVLLAARDPSWMQPGRWRGRLLPEPRYERPLRALHPELPPMISAPPAPEPGAWVPSLPPLAVSPLLATSADARPMAPLLGVQARFEPPSLTAPGDFLDRLQSAVPSAPPGLPTELLVVFDAAGEARHVWLLRSCGVPSLDLAAQLAVQRSRFGPVTGGYRGVLRIAWGPAEVAP